MILKGKTCVFVDWANVYNWKDELKKKVDPKKLFTYLKTYPEIKQIRFYFGNDTTHPASKDFLKKVKDIGYQVITKEVKFLKVYNDEGIEFIWKRKCDFDLELGLDALEAAEKYQSFVVFSGDGDYKTLYERLIKRGKQVIVVYVSNHLEREIWQMKKGIFKAELPRLGNFSKNPLKPMSPNRRSGA